MTADLDRPTLNIVLLGHGKMGKVIESLAPERGCRVKLVLDEFSNQDYQGITGANFAGASVCLDFTTPGAAFENIRRVSALGCNLVVGTTGWHDRLEEVRRMVDQTGIGMVYGANFSIGVELFYRAAKRLSEAFQGYDGYEPYISETHHRFKKDAPSGTALELKRQIEPVMDGRDIPVSSVRAGYIPGTHELGFDSEADTVILRHTARGRRGFAEGALYAARWIDGKKGLFRFADILNKF